MIINLFSPSPFPTLPTICFIAWTRKCIVRLLSLKEWEARVYDCDQQNAETAWRGRGKWRRSALRPRSFALTTVHHALLCFPRTSKCQSLIVVDSFLWKIRGATTRDFFSIRTSPLESLRRLCDRVKASAAVIVMVFCLIFVRPSRLRRVTKYSDEYRFGLVSRNLKC